MKLTILTKLIVVFLLIFQKKTQFSVKNHRANQAQKPLIQKAILIKDILGLLLLVVITSCLFYYAKLAEHLL